MSTSVLTKPTRIARQVPRRPAAKPVVAPYRAGTTSMQHEKNDPTLKEREAFFGEDLSNNDDPFYSYSNMLALKESLAQANAGKLTKHELIRI